MLAGMLGAYILALLSKEQAITLPALAMVYEHLYREDRSETTTSRKLGRYGPLWLVLLAYLLFRVRVLGALAPTNNTLKLHWGQVPLSAIALAGQYVGKLLWPVQLCVYYVFHPSLSLLDHRVLAGLLALLAIAGLFWMCWRSRNRNDRFASFGIVWFMATLAPVLNARWVGDNVFTERYLYLPSVGVAWLFGLGASRLWSLAAARRAGKRALVLAGLVMGTLFAARIVIRNRDWKDDFVLYARTLEVSPDASIISNNLGIAYWNAGDLDSAESIWRKLLARNPDDLRMLNSLGFLANRRHQYEEAKRFFQRTIELDPHSADRHLNLAETYQYMGMPALAEPELRTAVSLSPLNIRGRNMLGKLLFAQARVSEAEEQFRASLSAGPNAVAYDYLGMINYRRGAVREAEDDFRASLSLAPEDSYAHFGLGDVYQVAGRKAEALREYEAGLVKDPTNAQALAAAQQLRGQRGGRQ
jgi:tetratricopeptide (TPR) repeat protein